MARRKLLTGVAVEENSALLDMSFQGGMPLAASAFVNETKIAETAVVDQNTAAKNIATIEKDINNTLVIKNSLGSITDIVQNSLQDGGLKEESAALLEVAIKNSDVFAKEGEPSFPSVESFQYVRARQKSTAYALEAIQDRIENIWQWFIEKLSKLGAYLKAFIERNTISLRYTRHRLALLKDTLSKVSSSNPAQSIKNASIARALKVSGKFPINLVGAIKTVDDLASTVLTYRSSSEVKQIVDEYKKSAGNLSGIEALVYSIFTPPTTNLLVKNTDSTGDGIGLVSYQSQVLPGNQVLSFYTLSALDKGDIDMVLRLKNLGLKMNYVEDHFAPNDTIRIVSLSELKSLVDTCISIIDKFMNYKKDLESIQGQVGDLYRFATTQLNTLPKDVDAHQHAMRELLKTVTMVLPTTLYKPSLEFGNYAHDLVRRVMDYVNVCLNPLDKPTL